jgi:GNAT superfamily N-acetyltransferase
MAAPPALAIRPATPSRWKDLETLFGPRGACAGCWCMYWRLPRAEFTRGKGAPNRRALRGIVESRVCPGLLAYLGRQPVGWCALAPRAEFPVLGRSRILAPVDGAPVWSLTCLFVARPFRGRGVSVALLRAAVDHARRRGARILEGYPVEPRAGRVADVFAWTGLASAFRRARFREVARRAPTRPIMRAELAR